MLSPALPRRRFSMYPPSGCPTNIVPRNNEGYRTEQFPGIYLESPSNKIKKRRYLQPDAVEMPVYILYIRRTDGSISRYENFRFGGFEAAAMYIYEETLV